MSVRQATPKDIPYIMELYRLGLEELGETKIFDSMLLKKIVNSYHLAPCFLLEKDGNIIGMAGLTSVTSSHNGDAMLSDYMFYIKPEHRSLKNLGALVNSAKDYASGANLPLRLEFYGSVSQEVRKRLFKMHGFNVDAVVGVIS